MNDILIFIGGILFSIIFFLLIYGLILAIREEEKNEILDITDN